MTVGLMSLDDRVLHLPSLEHGVARCGAQMRDPWVCGPLANVQARARHWCDQCVQAHLFEGSLA